MAPSPPQLTASYRARLATIRQRVETQAAREWPQIDALDGSRWSERMAAAVAQAQTEAVRVGAAYLTGFLSVSLGRRVPTVAVDSRRYAGLSRDGRPLAEALQSPLIGVLAALKDGKSPGQALAFGRNRGLRMVEVDLMHAARSSLLDLMDADDRISGWERVTAGTCGACLALSGTTGPHFEVHPGCQCQPQPVVKAARHRAPVPSGMALFNALSVAEQDDRFGPDRAAAIRAGTLAITALVERVRQDAADDFITEAPANTGE